MTCPTCNNGLAYEKGVPCKWATETAVKWIDRIGITCHVIQCRYPGALRGAIVASGHARLATYGDVYDPSVPVEKQLIQGSNYLNVRSCFCNKEHCAYFTQMEER